MVRRERATKFPFWYVAMRILNHKCQCLPISRTVRKGVPGRGSLVNKLHVSKSCNPHYECTCCTWYEPIKRCLGSINTLDQIAITIYLSSIRVSFLCLIHYLACPWRNYVLTITNYRMAGWHLTCLATKKAWWSWSLACKTACVATAPTGETKGSTKGHEFITRNFTATPIRGGSPRYEP